ncbi:MAG: TRCF domain-containing protein, partial [Bacteroides sp.]
HQLRGRVGRSDRKAYCYILIPMTETLTPNARQRLKAIVEYSDLGSGMSLAMQDLNIRGAGNLLGAEQSGFIVDLGLETYYKILDEAVEELKQEEFSELFTDENKSAKAYIIPECVVDSDMPLYLPPEYVESTAERMRLYRKLTALQNTEEVNRFIAELQDRFGELPTEARELLKIPELKWTARSLGIQRIQFQNGVMVLQFVTPMTSPFYASDLFGFILKNIAALGNQAQLRQTETSLSLVIRGISSIDDAQELLKRLVKS